MIGATTASMTNARASQIAVWVGFGMFWASATWAVVAFAVHAWWGMLTAAVAATFCLIGAGFARNLELDERLAPQEPAGLRFIRPDVER
jgi:hypothetical protein